MRKIIVAALLAVSVSLLQAQEKTVIAIAETRLSKVTPNPISPVGDRSSANTSRTTRKLKISRKAEEAQKPHRRKKMEKLLESKPKYILLQFGHNDSHGKGKPESTDAATNIKISSEICG
jgi:hypothetical protein